MTDIDARGALEALIRARGDDFTSLSRLIGRNDAYIQQFIRRGTPRRLAEEDRRELARYFRVDEYLLGGPMTRPVRQMSATVAAKRYQADMLLVPRLDVGASAGPGAHVGEEGSGGEAERGFDAAWLRELCGGSPAMVSMIRVSGASMAPTLADGDDILVDRGDVVPVRDGIYVIRRDDTLMVKRLLRAGDGIDIVSDNPEHGGWQGCDPATIEVIGRVIWAGRRLR